MKKIFMIGLISFFGITNAQKIEKGQSQVNAGIGLSNGWGTLVYIGADYGVHNDISVGVEASYASKKYDYGHYSTQLKGTWFGIGVNGNYHFNTLLDIPKKWDLYAGVTLA